MVERQHLTSIPFSSSRTGGLLEQCAFLHSTHSIYHTIILIRFYLETYCTLYSTWRSSSCAMCIRCIHWCRCSKQWAESRSHSTQCASTAASTWPNAASQSAPACSSLHSRSTSRIGSRDSCSSSSCSSAPPSDPWFVLVLVLLLVFELAVSLGMADQWTVSIEHRA